ncbi:MAG: SusC/RagA family TonB-linked outer membrane protein, partial [Bacteroides sp.]|nr:SusC/RagA family TonB-linked outer membrane protein [Bacteroides sp.]
FRTPYGPNQNYSLVKYFTTDTWTQKGDAAKFPAITFANSAHNNRASDLWLRDASYLRLKNVEIGYSFSKKALQKMHLGSLRIYATGYNLLTFDKLKVIDPEARTGASTMYPVVKVMNLGLKLGF